MEYVRLGHSGLEVSKICLGCMSFGEDMGWVHDWTLNEADSDVIIKRALDLGINFFDTANVYSLGSSERILGKILKKYANRDDVVIATKVNGGPMREGSNAKGLSRKTIFQEVEHSLKRLDVDYIDLLYIHRWDYDTPIEETMSALNDLVKSGKVLYLGASSMYAWQFAKAQHVAKINGWTQFTVMQNHYNLLYREEEREMIPMCKDMGVALVPYSPLAAGRLSRSWDAATKRSQSDKIAMRKYDSTEAQDKEIVKVVAKIAEKHGVSQTQIALAWMWNKGISAPIVGVTKVGYLDDAVAALDVALTTEDMIELELLYSPHAIMGYQ